MRFFLALDAGGTRTECVLANEERVLARTTGDTLKLMSVGAQEATARLRQMLYDLAGDTGVDLSAITRTCMGIAGISSAGVRAWAEITLHEMVSGDLLLTGDDEIALEAAFDSGPGVLVVAGTGSRVTGRCANGMRVTAGGWGPMLGDEGSGTWIGLEAIRSGLRARDRGAPTTLLRNVLQFWQLDSVGALIAKANERPRPDFADLAPVVADCAATGDVLAMSVLERAGEELGAQVGLVLGKMAAAGCPVPEVQRIAFTGSVLARAPLVLHALRTAVQRGRSGVEVDSEAVDPVMGALARARRG